MRWSKFAEIFNLDINQEFDAVGDKLFSGDINYRLKITNRGIMRDVQLNGHWSPANEQFAAKMLNGNIKVIYNVSI